MIKNNLLFLNLELSIHLPLGLKHLLILFNNYLYLMFINNGLYLSYVLLALPVSSSRSPVSKNTFARCFSKTPSQFNDSSNKYEGVIFENPFEYTSKPKPTFFSLKRVFSCLYSIFLIDLFGFILLLS